MRVVTDTATSTPQSHTARVAVVSFLIDLVAVGVFVFLGRMSHGESNSLTGFLTTFWPFALGLAFAWIISAASTRPTSPGKGAAVWAVTLAAGMLIRWVSGQGIAFSFVLVAGIVTLILLLGWRLVWRALGRPRSRAPRD